MIVDILLIEDDEAMIDMLHRLFDDLSGRFSATKELDEGIKLSKEHPYHLILLDLRLVKTGKEEAFRAIRELKSHGSSLVVVTGFPEPGLEQEAKAAGADAFVLKNGDAFSKSLLLAATVVSLHLPRERFPESTFIPQIKLMEKMAALMNPDCP